MKKVFLLMAAVAMVGFVSCKKDPKPTPEPEKKAETATITAGDVTVEEGKTVKINATTNSTASITFETADASIATVSADGTVTGVKEGSTKITLKVAEVKDKFTAAEKQINVTVTAAPPEPTKTITIDGDFSDWTALEAGTFAKAINDPESPWEAVQEIRCYAVPDYVFYYIKYDAEYLEELMAEENEELPIRLCINTDGEFESGYTSYFLEGYDFIVEGGLSAEDSTGWKEYDGNFYQRIGSWQKLLEEGNGLCHGMGNGCEYEIMLDRKLFNDMANTSDVPMPMGDDFQTGIRFYWTSSGSWEELSNMPNSSLEEEMGNGYGYLMRVHTQK